MISGFKGINNVSTPFKVGQDEFVDADNVLVGNTGELLSVPGVARASEDIYLGLWNVEGRVFGMDSLGDLKIMNGTTGSTVVAQSLDAPDLAFCALPDGRTVFSDGQQIRVTDGTTTVKLGVDAPSSIGSVVEVAGGLQPGTYRYALTRVRIADGVESAPKISEPIPLTTGGLIVAAIDIDPAHKHRLYLTSEDGTELMLAGETTTATVMFNGTNDALTNPCRTMFLQPPYAGSQLAFWRGRLLIADGNTLWATMTFRPHHLDARRDFKQFESPITAIAPVTNGIYVGTTTALHYLSGDTWDKLTLNTVYDKGVVPGSAVLVEPKHLMLQKKDAVGGLAAVVIAGPDILHCFEGGMVMPTTLARYAVEPLTAVAATHLEIEGVPTYWACARNGDALLQNTLTGAVTRSTALAGYGLAKDLVAKADGLYRFTSGSNVNAVVISGRSLMNAARKKLADALFLVGDLAGRFRLVMTTEQGSYTYQGSPKNGVVKILPGRGLRGTYMQYALENADGRSFRLDAIEWLDGQSTKRRTG